MFAPPVSACRLSAFFFRDCFFADDLPNDVSCEVRVPVKVAAGSYFGDPPPRRLRTADDGAVCACLVRLATNLYGRPRGDIGISSTYHFARFFGLAKGRATEVWSPTPGVAATASSKRPASDIEVSTTNHPVDLKGQSTRMGVQCAALRTWRMIQSGRHCSTWRCWIAATSYRVAGFPRCACRSRTRMSTASSRPSTTSARFIGRYCWISRLNAATRSRSASAGLLLGVLLRSTGVLPGALPDQ
jgi:hypothetical protein